MVGDFHFGHFSAVGVAVGVDVGQHEYEDGHCCPTSEITEDICRCIKSLVHSA